MKRETQAVTCCALLAVGVLLWMTPQVPAAWIGAKSGNLANPEDPQWQPGHLSLYGQEINVPGRYFINTTDLVQLHGGICAAVATMNSFVYLEHQYPETYDALLTGGNPLAATAGLAAGWDGREGMYGPVVTPTSGGDRRIWENKVYWIEDKAPGTTILGGQYFGSTTGWYRADALEANTYPTWEFLWSELARCEDVEIAFDEHCVTLVDLFFDDLDGDGQLDPGEATKLGYLDPNPDSNNSHPNNQFQVADLLREGGRLKFQWWQVPAPLWDIEFAYTESPIPEPATLVLFALGLLLRRR